MAEEPKPKTKKTAPKAAKETKPASAEAAPAPAEPKAPKTAKPKAAAKKEAAPAAAPAAPPKENLTLDPNAVEPVKIIKAKGSKNVHTGIAHVLATFNNTI